jgi:hypothetical protein
MTMTSTYKHLSELTPTEIGRCIAQIEGLEIDPWSSDNALWVRKSNSKVTVYSPTTDYEIMFPILEREHYSTQHLGQVWVVSGGGKIGTDPSLLKAIAFLHIKIKFGLDKDVSMVEIPQ